MSRASRVCSVFATFLLLAAGLHVVDGLRDGEDLLVARKYREAAAALDAAARGAEAGKRDRILLLLAEAKALSGDFAGAVTTYGTLLEESPSSSFLYKARFARADAMARAGRFREASEVYRDEVVRLTGPARKEEIAATYLGLAEKALSGEKPDFAKARTFFDLAIDLGLSREKGEATRLRAARTAYDEGDPGEAIKRLTELLAGMADGDRKDEARLLLGHAHRKAGNQVAARRAYRDLLEGRGEGRAAGEASYALGLTYGLPEPQSTLDLERGVAAMREFLARFEGHGKAVTAAWQVALGYEHLGRFEEARAELVRLIEKHGTTSAPEVPEARARLGFVLMRQKKYEEAIAAWKEYLVAHPAHASWDAVQRAIVDADYARAERARARGKDGIDESKRLLEEFLAKYPLDPRNPEAMFALGEMEAERENWQAAIEAWERCVAKYPGTEAGGRAQFRVAQVAEQKLFDYVRALEAYRKVTWSSFAPVAQARIKELREKSLAVLTERSFRTDEEPRIKVTSRNIAKLRVRVFKLDLETYFRATHVAAEVERLHIEVIEADSTFESDVDKYLPHQEREREVKLPFREPGAYVVKMDDRELEATALVLVTDMGLIAKSSRHELFVFTQNLKENRVEAGARVFVSDGKKVVGEGVTDSTGVWRFKGPELKDREELRVFATTGGGSGAGTLNLSGLGYSVGLQPRGYVYTDRPAYQPGQVVQVKGVLRDVAGGRYVLPAWEGLFAEVLGSGGNVLAREPVKLTAFGSFALTFPLPAESKLGTYVVRVSRDEPGAPSFTGSFEVQRYTLDKIQLTIETARKVVFRGEKVQFKVKARYYHGEPVVGRQITAKMQGPLALHEEQGVTTATGEVEFQFPTTEFGEEATATVEATLVEENVAVREDFVVATTEFTAALSMVRNVYLAGEPFEVTVELKDRSGAPLARELTARLYRIETTRGENAEVEVEAQKLTTDAKEGKARVSLRSGTGGRHVVRVSARDRFGNDVSGALALFVSGKDDELKLRILSDRQSYRIGEKLAVRYVNRAGAKLALVATQGDGVLEHRAVVLAEGEGELEVPLSMLHAPNFALAVCMMDQNRFHQAEREFLVARDLVVEVKPAQETCLPGAELEVAVVVTDPEGKPVECELSLAVVDRSLLVAHPDKTPAIGAFFYGTRRETALRTATSCTFSYPGVSRKVPEELLREERREEERKKEEEEKAKRLVAERGDGFFGGRAPAPGAPAPLPREEGLLHDLAARGPGDETPGAAGGAGGAKPGARIAGKRNLSARGGGGSGPEVLSVANPGGSVLAGYELGLLRQAENEQRFFNDSGDGDLRARTENFFARDLETLSGSVAAATDEPRRAFSETGAWLSHVQTDATGKATVKVKLPDNATEWRLLSRGVTKATMVGQGEATLVTRKDLMIEPKLPRGMTEGDRATVRVDVHNLSTEKRSVAVKLEKTVGKEKTSESKTVDVEPARLTEVPWELHAVSSEDILLGASASSGTLSDAVEHGIEVRPWGIEHRTGTSGLVAEDATETLSLPEGREYVKLDLRIEVGPGLAKDLIGVALGSDLWIERCISSSIPADTSLRTASRGLTALLVLQHAQKAGAPGEGTVERLRGQVSGALAALVGRQRPDGGFAWIGEKAEGDVRSTAQCVRLMARAKRSGFVVAEQVLEKAVNWLQLTHRSRNDPKDRARIVGALAAAGRADFADLNALQRNRNALDLEGLSLLAAAHQDLGRPELAAELLEAIAGKVSFQGPDAAKSARPPMADVEVAALALLVLQRADARHPLLAPGIAWLYRMKIGRGWSTPQGTAAAVAAIVEAGGATRPEASESDLTIFVNDKELAKVPGGARGGFTSLIVPADWIKPAGNRVRFDLSGRGSIAYTCLFSGFEHGIHEAKLPKEGVRITRRYEPSRLKHAGKTIQPGFGVVDGSYSGFTNRIGRLPAGEVGLAQVDVWVEDRHLRDLDHFVLEEPLPAGCSVPRGSIEGAFDHVEALPDRLLFYFGGGKRGGRISYEIHGYLPGKYRVLPGRVHGVYRPDRIAYGNPGSLDVLTRGSTERDPYRMTPDELYRLGKALYDEGKLSAAGEHLATLLAEWKLREEPFKDASRMMLFVSVDAKRDADVVKYFEVLKDRAPELVIPFDKIVSVGRSYLALGEFERGLMVFRATAEASFLKEINVAGTLDKLGEYRSSIEFLKSLLLTYPDLNTIRSTFHSLGQSLAAKAAGIQAGSAVDPRVGTPDQLRAEAIAALREFLVLYPEDPQAPEASFGLASAHLGRGDLAGAVAVAEGARTRYPDSAYQDEFRYLEGFARFSLGQHDKALELLHEVATARFPDGRGGLAESENKSEAVFLIGQIHHAAGKPALALAEYAKVKERFTDAREAEEFFLRKELSLPEVETVAKGAAAAVKIGYRNLEHVDLKVYRVDLMRLYILEKSLNDIRGVELHGIKPFHQERVLLGDGKDYAEKTKEAKLPIDKPGAYLVVATGGDLIASGMVLQTDLTLEVQEYFDAGRLRVNVKRGDAWLPKVHVKVVGSGDGRFRSGETDLRGIFVADDLVGRATVIAKLGDSYAFHRGKEDFQPGQVQHVNPPRTRMPQPSQQRQQEEGKDGQSFKALDNLERGNKQVQERNREYLENLYRNDQKGVEVQRAR